MILHLVTDRRRLAPGADAAVAADCLLQQVRHAVAAGIDIIQLRERDLDGGALTHLLRQVLVLTRGTATRVVVNERLDVALAAGADGVHLRGDSLSATRARGMTPPGFLIGRSVRSVEDARLAGPVDYVIAGTVFSTPSKGPDVELLGREGLARIVAAAAAPVIGIGGIEPGHAHDLASTGAAGVAAIGLWMRESAGCRAVSMHDRTRTFRAAFDAANMKTVVPSS
jgi:thiamine-phosphate pyrophosphorylase